MWKTLTAMALVAVATLALIAQQEKEPSPPAHPESTGGSAAVERPAGQGDGQGDDAAAELIRDLRDIAVADWEAGYCSVRVADLARALGRIGSPAIPAVEKLLADDHPGVRNYGALAMAEIGRKDEAARQRLARAAAAEKDDDLRATMEAIIRTHRPTDQATGSL